MTHSPAQVDQVLALALKAAQAIRDKGPTFTEEMRATAPSPRVREYADMAELLSRYPDLDRYVELLHSDGAQALAELESLIVRRP